MPRTPNEPLIFEPNPDANFDWTVDPGHMDPIGRHPTTAPPPRPAVGPPAWPFEVGGMDGRPRTYVQPRYMPRFGGDSPSRYSRPEAEAEYRRVLHEQQMTHIDPLRIPYPAPPIVVDESADFKPVKDYAKPRDIIAGAAASAMARAAQHTISVREQSNSYGRPMEPRDRSAHETDMKRRIGHYFSGVALDKCTYTQSLGGTHLDAKVVIMSEHHLRDLLHSMAANIASECAARGWIK